MSTFGRNLIHRLSILYRKLIKTTYYILPSKKKKKKKEKEKTLRPTKLDSNEKDKYISVFKLHFDITQVSSSNILPETLIKQNISTIKTRNK